MRLERLPIPQFWSIAARSLMISDPSDRTGAGDSVPKGTDITSIGDAVAPASAAKRHSVGRREDKTQNVGDKIAFRLLAGRRDVANLCRGIVAGALSGPTAHERAL
jgi:hypothetical protein